MIQRIQSLYFFLSILISGVLAFFLSFFAGNDGPLMLHQYPIFMAGFLIIAVLSLMALISFKKRRNQVVYGRLAILVAFITFGFMLYHWYDNYQGEASRLGTGVFLPLIIVVLLSMANRAVMNDEAKVQAADRFR